MKEKVKTGITAGVLAGLGTGSIITGVDAVKDKKIKLPKKIFGGLAIASGAAQIVAAGLEIKKLVKSNKKSDELPTKEE